MPWEGGTPTKGRGCRGGAELGIASRFIRFPIGNCVPSDRDFKKFLEEAIRMCCEPVIVDSTVLWSAGLPTHGAESYGRTHNRCKAIKVHKTKATFFR